MSIIIILAYFAVLLLVSRLAGGRGTMNDFFRGGRRSPWYVVAFGMVGASISGITFVSVPGMVLTSGLSYLQVCLGFILGYFVVAYVLLPVYYGENLTTIYTFLRTINNEAYKTGAAFFIFSKLLGSAAKFFVPCCILSLASGLPLPVVVPALYVLIWLYTRRGGIRTLVWTDTFQTLCMIVALMCIICKVAEACGTWEGDLVHRVMDYSLSLKGADGSGLLLNVLSGMFIVIVMTGLDQDMMQKNLTCRSLRDAQRDMCSYGFAFLPVNALFLLLGVLLVLLTSQQGMSPPEHPDDLLTGFVMGGGNGVASVTDTGLFALFVIGIISTSFSTVDSSLTALTTTFCVDILEHESDKEHAFYGVATHKVVHFSMMLLLMLLTILFGQLRATSLIDLIYRLVSYTYGPLLGLFAYAIIHRRRPISPRPVRYGVIAACLLSPLLCLALSYLVPRFTGYSFGYELLLVNGLFTYLLLISSAKLHN